MGMTASKRTSNCHEFSSPSLKACLRIGKRVRAMSVVLATLFLTSAGAEGERAKSYPPYPDVWDWQVPPRSADQILFTQKLQDGDILFLYPASRKKRFGNVAGSTFFGKAKYTNKTIDEISIKSSESSKQLKMSTGYYILSNPGPTVQNCYNGLDSNVSVVDFIDQKAGEIKAIKTKVFLYVLPVPRVHVSPNHCNETNTFKVYVTALEGELVPLDDKTMLLVDRTYGVAVRIDEDLGTRSKLLSDRLFVLDQSELDKWLSDSHFGDRVELGGIDFGQMQNELLQWLSKRRKGADK